ncbi:DUF5665 domain-containing protein [Aestuariivita boseongensis]|uniref:DUF5665 domain-containing protein n=1 Tax=Aestuariivita boseongensis TaxID=1470562 RepID=UPI001FDEE738|nr:DUF5665 domain-containing protein [Aestuariivita boseongensis]
MAEKLEDEVAALRREMERLNNHRFIRIHDRPVRLLAFNFARGLAFGLGTVLGASLLLSLAAWALAQIDFIPVIGEWAATIAAEIQAVAEADK